MGLDSASGDLSQGSDEEDEIAVAKLEVSDLNREI